MSSMSRERQPVIRAALASFLIVFAAFSLGAQNLKDDITNNDLEGLKSKVALLSPDFKDFGYVAHYLKTCEDYQQSMLDYLLSQGASPDQVDRYGVGPLYWAIARDNLEAVKTLIAAKADVNAAWKSPKDGDYWHCENGIDDDAPYAFQVFDAANMEFTGFYDASTAIQLRPLAAALYSGNTDIVPALLKAGADPLAYVYRVKDDKASTAKATVYRWSNTVLDHAIGRFAVSEGELNYLSPTFFANAFRVWQAVLALPKERQPVIDKALTANLFAYFATGDMKDFKAELVKTGANTLEFLPYAALAENWAIIDLIYQYNQLGVDDPYNGSGKSLLYWAIANLHTGAARVLLENGATMPKSFTAEDAHGYDIELSPLAVAVRAGRPELVRLLLSYKADPNEGLPLQYAQSNPEVRQLLLAAGARTDALVTCKGRYGDQVVIKGSFLFDAANQGSGEAVAFWLAQGLDPQGDLAASSQPLVAAVARGCLEGVKALLAKGATPNVILTPDHVVFLDIDSGFTWHGLRSYAARLVDRADSALAKNRANQILKLLDKALASGDAKYKVGDRGPAGGIVFFDKGYESEGWRYLEVAPGVQGKDIVWGDVGRDVPGTAAGLGSGRANTAAIVAQGQAGGAAALCDALSLGGFDDWFLPSKYELMAIGLLPDSGSLYGSDFYWSSTQYDAKDAVEVRLDYLDDSRARKTYKEKLLAVRAF